MMQFAEEQLSGTGTECRDVHHRWRRFATWLLGSQVISVAIVAIAMWWLRRSFLDGVDCTTLGPYDCGYDGNLAAAYGAVIGSLFLLGSASAWLISRRLPRAGLAAGAVVAAAWIVVAAVLVVATPS